MNAQRTIYLFVNGIATWPGNFTNWNKRAVTYTHLHTPHCAEAFEYFCTAITRPFREDQRAKHFSRALHQYSEAGWKIVCVGHSNGCDVILDGLKRANWPAVDSLHLVSGACEANFQRNGLNLALLQNRIDKVFVYIAERDWALRLARTGIGHLLGYGTLGMHGALHVDDRIQREDRVIEIWNERFGHSDWWLPKNFAHTMGHFFFLGRKH